MNIINKGRSFLISFFTILLLLKSSILAAQAPFITTWKVDNPGISNSSSITILADPNYIYDYDIDWDGDGIYDDFNVSTDITHDYNVSYGTYTVAIRGAFPKMYFNNGNADHEKLITIEQWGDIVWEDMNHAFAHTRSMTYNAVDAPDLSNVSDMSYMFYNTYLFDGDLNNWNTSNVTNMSYMFSSTDFFNGNISNWNTGNVTNMSNMFYNAYSFNSNLNSWNVTNVTNMSEMFRNAPLFNGDLNNWNTVNVTDMTSIFRDTDSFSGNISTWNTVSITDMSNMFRDATAFNGNLNNWNTVNVTDMSDMFRGAAAFNSNLSNWNTMNVTDMSNMFSATDSFNGELNGWNTTNVNDMYAMFSSAITFNQDLNNWDTGNVTDMTSMFGGATSFNGNISNWNTVNVTAMSSMFTSASSFNSDINSWNTGNVSSMSSMFFGASSFNQDLDNWDVSSVDDMSGMFYSASAFNGNIDNWDVAYVLYMEYMFYNASLFDRNLGNWNISLPYMDNMLDNCGMSVANYDNTLIGWAAQSPESYINIGAAGLNYCNGEAARNELTNTYNWTITGDALDCPSNCFPPNNALVEVTTPTNALFSWDAVPEATFYQVKYRLRGTNNWSTVGTANTQRNVPNLIDKRYYQFKVRTQCGAEWSDFTDVQLFYTSTCDVPTGVTVTFSDTDRMRVRWDNNPDEIKGKIRYRAVGITDWITQNSADGNNFLWINNLPANSTIQFKVRSNCDGNDWSEYSGLYTHDLSVARLAQEEAPLAATKIYPNPTRDILNIAFETKDAEEVNIIISDNLGRTIHNTNDTYNEGIQTETIDVNRFANGYYFITIRSGERMETQKFMKME